MGDAAPRRRHDGTRLTLNGASAVNLRCVGAGGYKLNFDLHRAGGLVVLGIRFFDHGADHDSGGMAVKSLYYDGLDGRLLGDRVPWQGTAADIFVQLQFPLHSGRILGQSGRVVVSVTGLAVAMPSVTGLVIWVRKRRARRRSAAKRIAGAREA